MARGGEEESFLADFRLAGYYANLKPTLTVVVVAVVNSTARRHIFPACAGRALSQR